MKAFIEHDHSGLLYQKGGQWVIDAQQALAFASVEDAETFREARCIELAHIVYRLDPHLMARLSSRPPGIYQSGE